MVEEACSAMLDPGTDDLICANDNRSDDPAKTMSANKAIENDLISHPHLPPTQIETEN
jgi:hypothetical protein